MILTKILAAADHPYLQGKGGRMVTLMINDDYDDHGDYEWSFQPNNDLRLMQGLSIKSLKHHVALQPLAIIMGVGIAFVAAYIGRYVVRCSKITRLVILLRGENESQISIS